MLAEATRPQSTRAAKRGLAAPDGDAASDVRARHARAAPPHPAMRLRSNARCTNHNPATVAITSEPPAKAPR